MFTPPQSLVDAVRAGTLIPFVGAGISVGAVHGLAKALQFPDWPSLIEQLALRLDRDQKTAEAAAVRAAMPDSLTAAQRAIDALTRIPFLEEMSTAFDRRRPPAGADLSISSAIWRLGAPFLMTTNYDLALEWSSEPADVRRIHNDDPTPLGTLDTAPGRTRRIWHLHGSIDRPDTIVLTSSQYEKLYEGNEGKRTAYQNAFNHFRQLLTTRSFLFLGYSLDEPLLRALLIDILGLTDRAVPPKYLLLRQGQADAARKAEFRSVYNVEVLEFESFGAPLVAAIDAIGRAAWGDAVDVAGRGLTADMEELVADLLERLQGLVVAPADVARFYNAHKPRAWDHALTGGDGITELRRAILRLAEALAAGADEPPPLVHFVDRLRGEVGEPWLTRLADWLELALDRLAPDPEGRARMRARLAAVTAASVAKPMHVLVRIEPGEAAQDGWTVHAWSWSGTDMPEALFGAAGRRFDAGSSGDVVYELLDELEARRADPERTTLAFLVPARLAIGAIHGWCLPKEIAFDPPIGATYMVTIRPLERLGRPPLLRRRFKRAWDDLKSRASRMLALLDPPAAAPPDSVAAYLLDRTAARRADLGAELERQGVRCVVLRDAPSAAQLDHLVALIDTTTPVIVWSESGEVSGEAESAVRTLLQSGPLTELPRRLRDERACAWRGEAARTPLTLMWDDADHLPPDQEPAARARLETV